MKKTLALIAFTLLGGVAVAQTGSETVRVWIDCDAAKNECPKPPAPPAPPAPPSPPAPPALPHEALAAAPALPALPSLPAIPAPPAPPTPPSVELPVVPDVVHAACADKAAGSKLGWKLSQNETISGICERKTGRMQFRLQAYHRSR